MRNFHWSFVVIATLFLAGCERAEEVPQESLTWHPQVEAGKVLEGFVALDAMLDSAVNAGGIPGAEVLVVRQGEVVHHQVHGWSHPVDSVKLQKHSIFRICSQTKALTSTAALILWERGLLDLDDPVEQYIPSFAQLELLDSLSDDTTFTTIPHDRTMTIRHLLTHQSGLSYGAIGDPRFDRIYAKAGVVDLFTTEPLTAEENCERLAQTALIHAPGERWNYSLGLEVVVRVVEVVSGQPFDEFLKTELLDPLGMTDTHFYLPDSLADRLVPVFEPAEQGWKLHEHRQYTTDYPVAGARTFFGGGAGLSSTALDYAKFLQMYLNRGEFNGHRILQEATVDSIMSNQQGELLEGQGWYQGLAFGVQHEVGEAAGGSPAGTFFWSGYFNTAYAADPSTGTIGVLMKQTYGAQDPTSGLFSSLVFPSSNDSAH
ncbi:MAG: serine hydrolase [Bacteroidetes bacterium]|jgi:CubicO group peptidase (beta-lactamase class C family)|nr:serine hydrolase [Bacteroidota bacterium]